MKNILFSSYSLDMGGIETALVTLLQHISGRYNITLALEKKQGILLDQLPRNIKVIQYSPCKIKLILLRKFINFLKQFNFKKKYKNAFDFSISYSTYSFPCSFIARTASENNCLWVHNDYMQFYNNNMDEYKFFFEKLKVSEYKKIVFVSEHDRNIFISVFPEYANKTTVCNNLIDYAKIETGANEDITDFEKIEGLPTFINIGRHDEKQKRISRIINATRKLNEEGYNFRVVLIGEGEDTYKYKQEAQKLHNILFLGIKKNPYPYLKLSDCLLLSSDFEGYPVTFIEALVLNKPIITTEVSDSKKDIERKYGILTEKSTEGIYNAMKQFIENGFQTSKFDPKQYNQEILDKLKEIIN